MGVGGGGAFMWVNGGGDAKSMREHMRGGVRVWCSGTW
jgi:hypothetical protein